ncbi:MAG: hypothetical protein ACE5PV_25455 [Candidatus Poribacteria bacterium]
MKKSLENHPLWDELDDALVQIDVENLVMQHLKSCHYKLSGYWTEDEFYEEIFLIGPISADLVSMSAGETKMKHPSHRNYWIRLQFALKHDISLSEAQQWSMSKPLSEANRNPKASACAGTADRSVNEANTDDNCDIGELTLILAPDLKIIDENWSIDVESPYVIVKHEDELLGNERKTRPALAGKSLKSAGSDN